MGKTVSTMEIILDYWRLLWQGLKEGERNGVEIINFNIAAHRDDPICSVES